MTCDRLIHFRYSEIGLKGKNIRQFEEQLIKSIKAVFQSLNLNVTSVTIKQKQGQIELKQAYAYDSFKSFHLLPGIKWFGLCLYSSAFSDLQSLVNKIVKFLNTHYEDTIFNIDVRRYDKTLPFTSNDVWLKLRKNLKNTGNLRQDIKIFIYKDVFEVIQIHHAVGGLPIGASGRGLVLFSGGIDSPVAAYLAARRGIKFDLIHFSAYSESQIKKTKIYKIYKHLQIFNPDIKLFIGQIPFLRKIVKRKELRKIYNPMILFKRLIFKLAELHAKALYKTNFVLISGDSLGQVASQTISNMIATQYLLDKETLLLRPCVGLTKQEIINWAKQIGTYEFSIEEYQDCCSVLAKNSKTVSNLNKLNWQDKQIDLDNILQEAYKTIRLVV